jgi:hypothetical protein
MMKICTRCGEKLEENQAHCVKCGIDAAPASPSADPAGTPPAGLSRPSARPLPYFIMGFILGGVFVLLILLGFRLIPGKPAAGATKGVRIKLKILPRGEPASHNKGKVDDAVMKEMEQIIWNRLMNENLPVSIENRGNHIIAVEIQRETDMERVKRLVSRRGFLEFKEQHYNTSKKINEWRTVLDGSYLQKNGATVGFNAAMKRPYLLFLLNPEGTKKFAAITERNINLPIGIFIDGKLVDAPVIKEAIKGGSGVIEGAGLDRTAFESMKTILNAGFLPAEVEIMDCRVVDIDTQP